MDALSDDGRHGLTIIAFIGSVFSTYYAASRARGGADPRDHVALNVALYGRGARRWAFTERGRDSLARDARTLGIGPSQVVWDGTALTVEIDEVSVPVPRRVRGRIRLHPRALTTHHVTLDAAGAQHWWPIAPAARVEVEMTAPATRWAGNAYFDTNFGSAPLESSFQRWNWSRAPLSGERTAILYDATLIDGRTQPLGFLFDGAGAASPFTVPGEADLGRGFWGMNRWTRADASAQVAIRERLEDAPFYTRSVLSTALLGETVEAVHETLSLERLTKPWVRAAIPFRNPRRFW